MGICSYLYSHGINLRYLGTLYRLVTHPDSKRIVLIELIARTFKNFLEDEMRYSDSTQETQYKQLALEYFNALIELDDISSTNKNSSGTKKKKSIKKKKNLWKEDLTATMDDRYDILFGQDIGNLRSTFIGDREETKEVIIYS